MRHVRLTVAACLLSVPLVGAGVSFADSPGLTPKDSNSNGSCVGQSSSSYTQNGASISTRASHGQRGDELKALQANPAC